MGDFFDWAGLVVYSALTASTLYASLKRRQGMVRQSYKETFGLDAPESMSTKEIRQQIDDHYDVRRRAFNP